MSMVTLAWPAAGAAGSKEISACQDLNLPSKLAPLTEAVKPRVLLAGSTAQSAAATGRAARTPTPSRTAGMNFGSMRWMVLSFITN